MRVVDRVMYKASRGTRSLSITCDPVSQLTTAVTHLLYRNVWEHPTRSRDESKQGVYIVMQSHLDQATSTATATATLSDNCICICNFNCASQKRNVRAVRMVQVFPAPVRQNNRILVDLSWRPARALPWAT